MPEVGERLPPLEAQYEIHVYEDDVFQIVAGKTIGEMDAHILAGAAFTAKQSYNPETNWGVGVFDSALGQLIAYLGWRPEWS